MEVTVVNQVGLAFEDAYRSMYGVVFRASMVVSGDRASAEEAAQEAFARALERGEQLAREPWVQGWLITTAMNVAKRGRRRRSWSTRAQNEPDVDTKADIWQGMRQLSTRQQQCVVLHYFADLPLNEIAQALNVSEGTVKFHLSRARRALERTLGVEYET